MTDTPGNPKPDTLALVIAAIAELGEASTAALAEHLGLAYSTVTPRLRALETAGRAQRHTASGRTLWRLSGTPDTAPAGTPGPRNRKTGATKTGATKAGATKTGAKKTAANKSGTAKSGSADRGAAKARAGKSAAAKNGAKNGGTANGGAGTRTGRSPSTAGKANGRRAGKAAAAPAPEERTGTGSGRSTEGQARRGKGVLRGQVLALLQSNPDRSYTAGQVGRLLGGASAGAVANALHKLTHDGSVQQTAETPATFQAV